MTAKLPTKWDVGADRAVTMGRQWKIAGYSTSAIGRAGQHKATALKALGAGLGEFGAGLDKAAARAEIEERKGRKGGGGGSRGGRGGGNDANPDNFEDGERRILDENYKEWRWGDDKFVGETIEGASSEEIGTPEFRQKLTDGVFERQGEAWGAFYQDKGHKTSFLKGRDSELRLRLRTIQDKLDAEITGRKQATSVAAREEKYSKGGTASERINSGVPPYGIYLADRAAIDRDYANDGPGREAAVSELNFNMSRLVLNTKLPNEAMEVLGRPDAKRKDLPEYLRDLTPSQRKDLTGIYVAKQNEADTKNIADMATMTASLEDNDPVEPEALKAMGERHAASMAGNGKQAKKVDEAWAKVEGAYNARRRDQDLSIHQRETQLSAQQAQARLTPGGQTDIQKAAFKADRARIDKDKTLKSKEPMAYEWKYGKLPWTGISMESPEQLAATLRTRIEVNDAHSVKTGEPLPYLEPKDSEALQERVITNGDFKLMKGVIDGAGPKSTKVFSDMALSGGSEVAGATAYVGYAMYALGDKHPTVMGMSAGFRLQSRARKDKKTKLLNVPIGNETFGTGENKVLEVDRQKGWLVNHINGAMYGSLKIGSLQVAATALLESRIEDGTAKYNREDFLKAANDVSLHTTNSKGESMGGFVGLARDPRHAVTGQINLDPPVGLETYELGSARLGEKYSGILVPPNMLTNMIDDALMSITIEDLGTQRPIDKNGNIIDQGSFRSATKVNAGPPGKYFLLDEEGGYYKNPPGHPRAGRKYVLDITATGLEPIIRERVPGAY